MRKRRLFTTLTAIVMAFMIPFVSMAATVENVANVDDWYRVLNSFNDNSSDTELTIVLTADIAEAVSLAAKEGRTYYINGNEFTLAEVSIYQYDSGNDEVEDGASVKIDADMKGTGNEESVLGVYNSTEDTLSVEVTGNITAGEGQNGASVVGENIVADITGNITAGDTDEYDSVAGTGLTVQGENLDVTVNGSVTGGNATGLYSTGGAGAVVVDGNVNEQALSGEEEQEKETGVKVTITGDVTGGDSEYRNGGDGLVVCENDNDVPGDKYNPADEPEVTVGGNVTGGDANSEYGLGGLGVLMDSSATVNVGGDVAGGNAVKNTYNGEDIGGNGVYVVLHVKHEGDGRSWENGKLFIEGIVKGGSDASGRQAAAIFYNTDYMGLDESELEKQYFPESQHEKDIEEVLKSLKENNEAQYLALDILGRFVNEIERYAQDEGISDFEVIYNKYLHKFLEKACEATGLDLEKVMENNDPNDDTFMKAMLALSEEAQIELSRQFYKLYTESMKDIYKNTNDNLEKNSIPDVTVWGFDENGEKIASDDMSALLVEILNDETDYIIKVAETKNGKVDVSTKAKTVSTEGYLTAKAGETVIVNPTANEGYKLSKVTVSGTELAPVDGVYSFVVPEEGQVLVAAEFEEIIIAPENAPSGEGEAIVQPEEVEPEEVEPEEEESNVPQTGDMNPVGTYAVVMLAAMAVALIAYKKINRV